MDEFRDSLEVALSSNNVFDVIWAMGRDGSAIALETVALGIRRPTIGAEIKKIVEESREQFISAIKREISRGGLELPVAPMTAILVLQSLSQVIATEKEWAYTPPSPLLENAYWVFDRRNGHRGVNEMRLRCKKY